MGDVISKMSSPFQLPKKPNWEFWLDWRKLLFSRRFQMLLAGSVSYYLLVAHFGKGRRSKRQRETFFQSSLLALQSKTMRNMLLLSAVIAAITRRLFGLSPRRTFPAFFLTMWTLIYRFRVVETPHVWFRRTYFNTSLIERSKLAQTPYWPCAWAFNRHAQTITCYALSSLEWVWADEIRYETEEIDAWDPPNKIYLDWATMGEPSKHSLRFDTSRSSARTWDTPIVFCIHGLGDDREIPYMKRFARECLQRGWRVCVYSYWRFDFEDSRDLHLALEHIQQKFPNAPISAVGWSAGAYPLCRYLQKIGKRTPLVTAICQSGCLDFGQAVTDVFSNENPTYGVFLALQTRVCIKRHLANDQHLSPEVKESVASMLNSEFDSLRMYDRFLALTTPQSYEVSKHSRFQNAIDDPVIEELQPQSKLLDDDEDWQVRVSKASHYVCKAIDYMERIEVTTLLLHSEDDPVVSSEHIEWSKLERNRHIIVAHTRRGGHCSWYTGFTPFGDTWGDVVTCNFISTLLESHAQTHFLISLVQQSMQALQIVPSISQGRQFSQHFPRTDSFDEDYITRLQEEGQRQHQQEQRQEQHQHQQEQRQQPPNLPRRKGPDNASGITPRAMARIYSASDLVNNPEPTLAVAHGRGRGYWG